MATKANQVLSGVVPKNSLYALKVDVTMSASYTTDGEELSLADDLPAGATILHALAEPTGANLFQYDAANDKLLAYVTDTGVEVANAVNLSAVTVKLLVFAQ